MDEKSKILLTLLLVAALVSILLTYDRTIIRRDFEVINAEPEELLEAE